MSFTRVFSSLSVTPLTAVWRASAIATALVSASVLTGCVTMPTASSAAYTSGQAQRAQIVQMGTVESVRPVTIQKESSNIIGTLAGGALGGILGNSVGGGSGKTIATAGGAVLGAVGGNLAEEYLTQTAGLEIVVRLDNGQTQVITQAADVHISAGQRIRLISGGGGPARVTPAQM